jgi:hypothetical protein|tara:strand:+ start:6340 stop:6753 length:414 start_codon:yes stop_codon:yes gene_type:complete
MALELTLILETELPIPFTVADGAGIEKGTLLTMSDPMTAAGCTTDNAIIAGVAAEEKIANDGNTKLAVYRGGIFKATIGAAGCTVGDALISDCNTGDPNEIVVADDSSENILGTALETATDLQTALIELKPFGRKIA